MTRTSEIVNATVICNEKEKKQMEKKQSDSMETTESETPVNMMIHGTRAMTRAASKQVVEEVKPMAKRAARLSKDSCVKSDKPEVITPSVIMTSTTIMPTPTTTPTVSLRQSSPRKAAQQHKWITNASTRSQRTVESNIKSAKSAKAKQSQTIAVSNKQTGEKVVEMEEWNDEMMDAMIEDKNIRFPLSQRQMMDIDDMVTPDVLAPLLRLSPPPNGRDYCFNLDNNEGVCDLFG